MKFSEVATKIVDLCNASAVSFQDKAAMIIAEVDACTSEELLEHLDWGGVIPESFDHDSTEEKLFAKYCDGLLARALRELGLGVSVIVERADSADVIATEGEHQIIGDAKAFRLSRTAKNQKDFKVEALNQWRRGAHYATLVAPLYQYPSDNSQIYSQASRYNVTLLSSTHLAFLIRHKPAAGISLQPLWELGTGMTASSSAAAYWNAVTKAILQITGVPKEAWEAAVRDTYARLPRQADQEIRHWEEEKARIAKLNHDQAVMELIEALKIDSKIATIRRNSVRGGA